MDAECIAENHRGQQFPPFRALRPSRQPDRQDANRASYLVQARFQHQNAVVLVVTVSRRGEVDGLELYPRSE
jgi:hypothetical protein